MFSTMSGAVQDININIRPTREASLLGSDENFHTWNNEGLDSMQSSANSRRDAPRSAAAL